MPSYEPVRELETINLTDFNLKTAADIIHLGCAVGPVDCKDAWKTLLTPQGACSVLELSNSQTLGLNYSESPSMRIFEFAQKPVISGLKLSTG